MKEQTKQLVGSLPHFALLFKQYDARNNHAEWQIIQWEDIPPDKVRPEQTRPVGEPFANRTAAMIASYQSAKLASPSRSSRTEKGHMGVWKWTQNETVCYQSVMPVCPQDKLERKAQGAEEKSGPANAMVRLSEKAHKELREWAEEDGKTIQATLEEAVREYGRHRYFEAMDAAYRRLQSDPAAWAEELEERRSMEGTLMDGIDTDEIWHEDGTVTILSEQERKVA